MLEAWLGAWREWLMGCRNKHDFLYKKKYYETQIIDI